ncbi:hypothetical protein [Sorangium sp. So ce131]|uniref:hypothetical protein n=1 Tax=Sorangium sp. So ce131 TaxID=3133282 RepID=UPI003F615AD6
MTQSSPTARADANRIALRAVRAILDAAEPLKLSVVGTPVDVQVDRLASPPWPARGLLGLDEAVDGPLPRAVLVGCSWPGGSVDLLLQVAWWQTTNAYRHLTRIKAAIALTNQEISWISVALALREGQDGQSVAIGTSFSPFKRKEHDVETALRRKHQIKTAVDRSELPLISPWWAETFSVKLPEGDVLPSPREGFARLVHIALLKLPFFVRGEQEGIKGKLPFDPDRLLDAGTNGSGGASSEERSGVQGGAPAAEARRDSLWSLPGGVRHFKQTLDDLLDELREQPLTEEELSTLFRERYEVTGATARSGYTNLLLNLGLAQLRDGRFALTPDGEAYLLDPLPRALFERLHRTYTGLIEVLVIASALGRADTARVNELLPALLDTVWRTTTQSSIRRNWLLSTWCATCAAGRRPATAWRRPSPCTSCPSSRASSRIPRPRRSTCCSRASRAGPRQRPPPRWRAATRSSFPT